jgi:steroid delta-isomerase-like uncharacterized protein
LHGDRITEIQDYFDQLTYNAQLTPRCIHAAYSCVLSNTRADMEMARMFGGMQTMSTEENEALVQRGFALVSAQDVAAFDTFIAPDYVNYAFPQGRGPEGMRQVMGMFYTAFPDMNVTIEDMVAEGDKVASRGYFSGTHNGDFMGIPATGKTVKVTYSDVWRLKDGKAVENWVQLDMLGMMQQLGVAPSP